MGRIISSYRSVDHLIAEMLGREGGGLPPRLLTASDRSQEVAESSLEVDRIAYGDVDEKLIPDAEGRTRITLHVRYE